MNPSRGEIWYVRLDPTVGHEQGGTRPALVLSVDKLNHGPAGLVVVLPLTTVDKGIVTHVAIEAQRINGLRDKSFIKCEEVRCVSKDRLVRLSGTAASKTMEDVGYRVALILGLA